MQPTPKSPEQIMEEFEEKFIKENPGWRETGATGELILSTNVPIYIQNFLRSSMARLLCYMAERMPEAKTAKELYPNVEAHPTEDYAFACEGKNMYNAALKECRTLLLEEARKITGV